MSRRLSNLLMVVSLLLLVAVTVLWVRGRQRQEYVAFTFGGHSPAVGNYPGGVFLAWNRNTRTASGFSYLGYRYGDDPRLGAHRLGDFAYRNDSYAPSAPGQPARSVRAVMFPTWLPAALCAVAFSWSLRRSLRLRSRKPGLCQSCGYDLRATPEKCPECGTPAH